MGKYKTQRMATAGGRYDPQGRRNKDKGLGLL